jgi:hypothetical protein
MEIIQKLIRKGVSIPNPESVFISDEVDIDRISGKNVTIYSGCKLIGKKTLIMKGSQLGYEAPVTIENAFLGENTKLLGGFFSGAVFVGNNNFGSCGHVRKGTILEEEASAAHAVGLKQTILFPFVTLGSLINFCDCFMAGGTSRKNHSEVGSSFIHFNYTPAQDKATPSMMGDVHQGVMLDSNPIFLGGQGGLVGPVRINYGCLTTAGSIIRKNELKEDMLLLGGSYKDMSVKRQFIAQKHISHIYNNNIHYISSLIALKHWYKFVRPLFVYDKFSDCLIKGMQAVLDEGIKERLFRLEQFFELNQASLNQISLNQISMTSHSANEKILEKYELAITAFDKAWNNCELNEEGERFSRIIEEKIMHMGKNYIPLIKNLLPDEKGQGSLWLLHIQHTLLDDLIV